MKIRMLTVALAVSVLFSFTACDIFGTLLNRKGDAETKPSESETTTVEETTTTEATTTTEETTTEETTTSEETTTESITPETSATPTPTTAPTKKPTKAPAKPTYVPKGWSKHPPELWGAKVNGKRVYIIENDNTGAYKGWYNGQWVKLYVTKKTLHNHEDEEHDYVDVLVTFYRDKKHKYKYASFHDD